MAGKNSTRGSDEFIGGLAVAVVFGYLRIFHGWGWWVVFPIVFGGLVPMLNGVKAMLSPSERNRKQLTARQIEERGEKEVLRLARSQDGILTPALAALHTSLSLSEAEKILQGFAGRGYAEMIVRDDGRIEYEFPEFRKQ